MARTDVEITGDTEALGRALTVERVRTRIQALTGGVGRWQLEVGNDTIGWIKVPCADVSVEFDQQIPYCRARVTFNDTAINTSHWIEKPAEALGAGESR